MNLYYAMGGGLGHLTRASAFLQNFGLDKNTSILTLSEFAKDKRVVGDIDVIEVEEKMITKDEDYLNFLRKLFANRSYEKIYLDTFPFGIKREFVNFDFGNAQINYIARLMDWGKYSKSINSNTLIKFDRSYFLEPLEDEHKNFILKYSNSFFQLILDYPIPHLSTKDLQIVNEIRRKKVFWLIVHSGNSDEISDLLSIADSQREIEKREIEIVLITPTNFITEIPNCSIYNLYPASVLFPFASRIFTACGFNVMQQTETFRHKHQCIPYQRAFDRQHKRAERVRREIILNA